MAEERKTLEQREQMTDLERLRHSASHVLATAILKIWPEAQFAAGPPVENGFYYDVDLPHRISPDDFEKIEAEMKKEIKANHPFERIEVSRDEALAARQARPACGIRRATRAKQIQARHHREHSGGRENFTLSQWRVHRSLRRPARHAHRKHRRVQAHERRQRILQRRRKKSAASTRLRHRVQNQKGTRRLLRDAGGSEEAGSSQARTELELFVFDDDVGPGLPMFLPRGAVIAEELEKLAKETEFAAGYQRVLTPHIARESLYLKSGHLPYYAESMFPPMELEDKLPSLSQPAGFQPDEEEAEQDARLPSHAGSVTSDRYYLRAMNCPHHHKLFAVDSKKLSRSAFAPGGIRHVLSLREERRVVWINAGAFAAHERCASVHDTGAVRERVQRRERNVSELFQAFRD